MSVLTKGTAKGVLTREDVLVVSPCFPPAKKDDEDWGGTGTGQSIDGGFGVEGGGWRVNGSVQ